MDVDQAVAEMMRQWDALTPGQQRIQYEHVLRVAITDDRENQRRIVALQQRVSELEER